MTFRYGSEGVSELGYVRISIPVSASTAFSTWVWRSRRRHFLIYDHRTIRTIVLLRDSVHLAWALTLKRNSL